MPVRTRRPRDDDRLISGRKPVGRRVGRVVASPSDKFCDFRQSRTCIRSYGRPDRPYSCRPVDGAYPVYGMERARCHQSSRRDEPRVRGDVRGEPDARPRGRPARRRSGRSLPPIRRGVAGRRRPPRGSGAKPGDAGGRCHRRRAAAVAHRGPARARIGTSSKPPALRPSCPTISPSRRSRSPEPSCPASRAPDDSAIRSRSATTHPPSTGWRHSPAGQFRGRHERLHQIAPSRAIRRPRPRSAPGTERLGATTGRGSVRGRRATEIRRLE